MSGGLRSETSEVWFLTWAHICGEAAFGLMSSTSVKMGLCGLLTSRLPSLTIPGIWVILTWWGFTELFFCTERPLLDKEVPVVHTEHKYTKKLDVLALWRTQIEAWLPLGTRSEWMLLFWLLAAEDETRSSPLISFWFMRILLFFFGWISSKSSSSQSSATYSSSGTRAEVLLDDKEGVLENWGCDGPWSRVLALPKLRMALWYSSLAKTEATGGSLVFSRTELGAELASTFGGNSFWLVAEKLFLGRTGRRGLTEQSESLESEELLSYKIKKKTT